MVLDMGFQSKKINVFLFVILFKEEMVYYTFKI